MNPGDLIILKSVSNGSGAFTHLQPGFVYQVEKVGSRPCSAKNHMGHITISLVGVTTLTGNRWFCEEAFEPYMPAQPAQPGSPQNIPTGAGVPAPAQKIHGHGGVAPRKDVALRFYGEITEWDLLPDPKFGEKLPTLDELNDREREERAKKNVQ